MLDGVRQTYPNVEYLVIVGGDDAAAVRAARRPDDRVDRERLRVDVPRGERPRRSLTRAKILTDDPYGTTEPVPFLNRQLDVPSLVTGRLVETPANINAQLDAFLNPPTLGHLHPASALTTGYDFLSDGATAGQRVARHRRDRRREQVRDLEHLDEDDAARRRRAASCPTGGAAAPDIVSLNAHADHNRFEPAAGHGSAERVRGRGGARRRSPDGSSSAWAATPASASVDAFVPSNNLDWAQIFAQKGAADYAGNTGYGYGDTTTIAYSEDLNSRFAANAVAGAATNLTGANLTIGEALTVAKQEYKGALGIVGVYDEKAMAELTLYGLPMYRIGGIGVARRAASGADGAGADRAAAGEPLPRRPRGGGGGGDAERPARLVPDRPGDRPAHRVVLGRPHVRRGDAGAAARLVLHGHRRRHRRALPPDRAEGDPPDHDRQRARRAADGADVQRREPVRSRLRAADRRLVGSEPEVQFDDLAFPSKLQAVTTFRRLQDAEAAGRARPGPVLRHERPATARAPGRSGCSHTRRATSSARRARTTRRRSSRRSTAQVDERLGVCSRSTSPIATAPPRAP